MTRAFADAGVVKIETIAKPGVLYKFSKKIEVTSVGSGKFSTKPPGTIMMYLETIRHIEMSRLLWYEHKFLDPDGKVVHLASKHWSNGEPPWRLMEAVS
jgi:hypothetical protein